MHFVFGRYADKMLIERAVMNAAETQAIAYGRLACRLEVADDVSSVEESAFL